MRGCAIVPLLPCISELVDVVAQPANGGGFGALKPGAGCNDALVPKSPCKGKEFTYSNERLPSVAKKSRFELSR